MPDSVVSLLGDTLSPPLMPEDTRLTLAARHDAARAVLDEHPNDPEALIWLGRRTAYLGEYRAALAHFSDGIARWPEDVRFYRHRGHRLITLRSFAEAERDLEMAAELIAGRADEVEPDGQPNARNTPTSTLHFNIWYHLGLVRVLIGEFDRALDAYRSCLAVSGNPDALVATSYWSVMTLRRLGRDAEAAALLARITPEMDVIQDGAYHRLLLLFQGVGTPQSLLDAPENSNATLHDATIGYGIGVWRLTNGRPEEAARCFRRVYAGPQWAAFGFIAAEAELARFAGVTG